MRPPQTAISLAIQESWKSPCKKSQRGAAAWNERITIGAHNYLPDGECDGSDACRAACGRRCIHAEQEVLLRILRERHTDAMSPFLVTQMLHVKTVDGQAEPSGPPSCLECAKLLLGSGIGCIWLLHNSGWRAYPVLDFYRETLKTLNLEV